MKKCVLTILMFLIILGLLIMININSYCETSVEIKAQPDFNLKYYKDAFIDVQNEGYGDLHDKRVGRGASWVLREIRRNIKSLGINVHLFDNIKSNPSSKDLIVECYFKYGWGVPRFTRHFKVEAKFRSEIYIKFINAKNRKTVAEAFYKRRIIDGQEGDINKIFIRLQEELGKKLGSKIE